MNYLKKLLEVKIESELNIFLSCDGESIPFGSNWIHSIEKGLNDAIIMFVFITPNSIKSDWIYFESGFVYAKKIKVIPIGYGVDISQLRPPLNLLQGFNLISFEGLNNLIKIINDECHTKFSENFQECDYLKLEKYLNDMNGQQSWKYIDCFNVKIYDKLFAISKNVDIASVMEQLYEKIKAIVGSENAYSETRFGFLTNGLYVKKGTSKLEFDISPSSLCIYFPKIVELLLNLTHEDIIKYRMMIKLESDYILNSKYTQTSIIIDNDERFKFANRTGKDYPGYQFKDLEFDFEGKEDWPSMDEKKYLQIIFPKRDVSKQILELVKMLYKYKIIDRIFQK